MRDRSESCRGLRLNWFGCCAIGPLGHTTRPTRDNLMAGHGTSAASRPACGTLDRATLAALATIIIHYVDYQTAKFPSKASGRPKIRCALTCYDDV